MRRAAARAELLHGRRRAIQGTRQRPASFAGSRRAPSPAHPLRDVFARISPSGLGECAYVATGFPDSGVVYLILRRIPNNLAVLIDHSWPTRTWMSLTDSLPLKKGLRRARYRLLGWRHRRWRYERACPGNGVGVAAGLPGGARTYAQAGAAVKDAVPAVFGDPISAATDLYR